MAFGAGTILEVNTGGSDVDNGGGFDPGAAAMATDLAATSATGSAPVVTSATYTFVTADTDRYLFIQAGTGWVAGWYPVTSVAGGAATINASIGAVVRYGTGATNVYNTVAGCHTSASPTGGTWSMDYSQGSNPFLSFTDMVIGATTTQFTSVLKPAGPNMIGNFISVTAGTGFSVQRVEVTAFTAIGLIATCDKTLGTAASTGGTGGLGGALASPGQAGALANNNAFGVFVKGSGGASFTLSDTGNVSGGKVADGSTGGYWIGYDTHRVRNNVDAGMPTLVPGANSVTCISVTSQSWLANFIAENTVANKTGVTGFQALNFNNLRNLKAIKCPTFGFNINAQNWVENCNATNCTNSFSASSNMNVFMGCSALGEVGGVASFASNSGRNYAIRCIATTSAVTNAGGFNTEYNVQCVAYALSGTSDIGFSLVGGAMSINCIAYGMSGTTATGYLKAGGGNGFAQIIGCAVGNNTTNASTTFNDDVFVPNLILLGSDPFTNGPGGNFSLNDVADGGALLKALGWPTSFLGLASTQSLDIGTIQTPAVTPGYPTRARVFTGM